MKMTRETAEWKTSSFGSFESQEEPGEASCLQTAEGGLDSTEWLDNGQFLDNSTATATATAASKRRKRLLFRQSPREASSDTDNNNNNNNHKLSPFRLRLPFVATTAASHEEPPETSPELDKSSHSRAASQASSSSFRPHTLFRDKNDIVAYQEWPTKRRQIRYQCPWQKSPTSTVTEWENLADWQNSVETVATRLGRSPVKVSFAKTTTTTTEPENEATPRDTNTSSPPPSPGIALEERVPTGKLPAPKNNRVYYYEVPPEDSAETNSLGSLEEDVCKSNSCLNGVELILLRMMCID